MEQFGEQYSGADVDAQGWRNVLDMFGVLLSSRSPTRPASGSSGSSSSGEDRSAAGGEPRGGDRVETDPTRWHRPPTSSTAYPRRRSPLRRRNSGGPATTSGSTSNVTSLARHHPPDAAVDRVEPGATVPRSYHGPASAAGSTPAPSVYVAGDRLRRGVLRSVSLHRGARRPRRLHGPVRRDTARHTSRASPAFVMLGGYHTTGPAGASGAATIVRTGHGPSQTARRLQGGPTAGLGLAPVCRTELGTRSDCTTRVGPTSFSWPNLEARLASDVALR